MAVRAAASVVVASRSCPPDIGGYQRQFATLLPHIAAEVRVIAVGATRQPPDPPNGWPMVRTLALPAHRLPRLLRGLVDPVIVVAAIVAGLAARLRYRAPCTLLLLSPGLRGARSVLPVWGRVLGDVVVRFPTSGDAQRLRSFRRVHRIAGVTPAPSQLDEVRNAGLPAVHIPNAVVTAAPQPDGRTVAVIGRLVARKRVDLVVAAWSAIADRHSDWRLAVVGSGQGERDDVSESLRRQVAGATIPRVSFYGEVSDPWRTLAGCGVFVIASEREGSPNTFLEALARGIPVVAPERAVAEWFRPIPPHVPFEGPGHLAQVLDALLADGDRRSALAAEGVEFVARHHSVHAVGRMWQEALVNGVKGVLTC